MRNFLESVKTIILELIGITGGFVWGRATNWDYEPMILLAVSSLGFLVSLSLLWFKKPTDENSLVISKTEKQTNNDNEENASHNFSKETPESIMSKIDKAPLYQKDDVAKHFVGLLVRWNLRLFSIFKDTSNPSNISVRMFPFPIGRFFPIVRFDTNTDSYPVFKIAEKEKEFIVVGKITNCDENRIELNVTDIKEK